jgi:hypothetical protein
MTPSTELRGGRYVLLKTLGEGSQGETYEAVDKREGRLVAIKRFRVGKAKAWKDVELAEREATTLASLEHDLLPRYVEHFEEDGALVLVMERIEGESLAALRKKSFIGSVSDVERLLADASRALSYLHGRAPPIIHRDLKPGNVIRRPDGSFAFVDFGAVRDRLKVAGGSTIVGTFGYMAPEQFQGRASPASDVYGIGATALTMLTGCEPEDLPHTGLAIDVAKAVPASTPPSLVRTLGAMLDPDPDTRASSIAEALARGGARQASTRAAPARSERPSKSERAERKSERTSAVPRRSRVPRRRASFAVRAFGWLALLVARVAIWLSVGVVLPLLFTVLSLVFGKRLRDAARACHDAAARAEASMARSARRLAGEEEEPAVHDDAESDRVRIAGEDILRSVRAVTPAQAQEEAIRAAERRSVDDAEAWADRRATEEAERWEPPEAWVERDEDDAKRKAAKRRP